MAMTETHVSPVTASERVEVVDVLRGVAVGGILIGNLQWFSGYGFIPPAISAEYPLSDQIVRYLVHFLVEGKFYSIFSLLFGFGFAMQMSRAAERGDTDASLFKRRLFWLMVIGALHAVFLWYGDILLLYALLGFVLLLFRRTSDERLVKWAMILLAVPIFTYAILLSLFLALAPPDIAAQVAAGQLEGWNQTRQAVPSASYFQILTEYNSGTLVGRWVGLFVQMRVTKVLAMFLIGMYVFRRGYLHDLVANRRIIARAAALGLGIGLGGNAIFAAVARSEADFPPSWSGMLGVILYAVSVPALAIGIVGLIAMLWESEAIKKFLVIFAPAGRMALTNYLMQTVICVFIFYGYGFGQFGRVGAAASTLIAIGIFAAQLLLSWVWLKYFKYGPLEWVWRQLTYRQRLSLRRTEALAANP